jgi:hypothetical protein
VSEVNPDVPGAETYHGLLGKGADLLDGTGSTLLEADTVGL